jgi:hypothetical protein
VFEVKNMAKHEEVDPENVKEILQVVSSEIPSMIKSILSSVFSEEAGRNMGKAAAAYYKELKDGGLPEPIAVKMTEEYMRTFTSLGDMLRSAGKGGWGPRGGDEIGRHIEKRIRSKMHEEEE